MKQRSIKFVCAYRLIIAYFALHMAIYAGLSQASCLELQSLGSIDERVDRWREDLHFLADELPKRHKNLYAYQTETWFKEQVAKIDEQLADLTDDAIRYELERLVAGLREGHTRLQIDPRAIRYLPLNFYWFREGVFVVAASDRYGDLFAGRVVQIGDAPIEEVTSRLAEQIARDNDAGLKASLPFYLQQANLLFVAGFWDDVAQGRITVAKNGETISMDVRSLSLEEAQQVNWTVRQTGRALCEQKPQLPHWNDVGPDRTLYFKYNRCVDSVAFNRLVRGTKEYVKQNPMNRFVLDLRDNGGGDSRIFRPLYAYLKDESPFNEAGKLYVVIGRRTYSSAILNALEMQETKAILVGEPTGGRPNHYGETKTLELPNSKLKISYSTKYFRRVADDDLDTLRPDIDAEPTFEAWQRGEDPALQAILNRRD